MNAGLVRRDGSHVQSQSQPEAQDSRPGKRMRVSHPDSTTFVSASSPRQATQPGKRPQTGRLQLQAREAKKLASKPANNAATGAETPPEQPTSLVPAHDTIHHAYHDTHLHGTGSGQSADPHIPIPRRASVPVHHRGASSNHTEVMSIASGGHAVGLDLAPKAPVSLVRNSSSAGEIYNPPFEQTTSTTWSTGISSQHAGLVGQHHHHHHHPYHHTLPVQTQPPSNPAAPPLLQTSGEHFPFRFSLHSHAHCITPEMRTSLPATADMGIPGQESHTVQTQGLDPTQPPVGNGDESQLHHHHHQHTRQDFFPSSSGQHEFDANASTFPVAVHDLPIQDLDYNAQFEPGVHSHQNKKPHHLLTGSFMDNPIMDDGPFLGGHIPPMDPLPVHFMGPNYGIDGLAPESAVPVSHEDHSYGPVMIANHAAEIQPVGGFRPPEDDGNQVEDDFSHCEEFSDVAEDVDSLLTSQEPLSNSESGARQEIGQRTTKKRRSFTPSNRLKTAETRKRKACIRCRPQKTRCDVDAGDPNGACVACKNYSRTSKKTLHQSDCFRGKLTDVVLYRSGGLKLTNRWQGTEMKDIASRVQPEDIREIKFTLGICDQPIVVNVVAFETQPGDEIARFWIVREGDTEVRKQKDLTPYCLANVQETARYFDQYVKENAIQAMLKQRTGPVKIEGQDPALLGVIERTYRAAVKHFYDLKNHLPEGSAAEHSEFKLLSDLFVLWFATRHTTGSAYICGPETLGMKPEVKDETYPLFGKVSLPRMILAQFDSINHSKLLSKYGKSVLTQLETIMLRNQSKSWYTIYLCLFILLREASWISEDRYRHARDNYGMKVGDFGTMRYSIPAFVEQLQDGCNNLLHHWHYYNCKPWPDPKTPWDRHKTFLADLSSEQYDLVMETMSDPAVQKQLRIWKQYKKDNGRVDAPGLSSGQDQENPYQGSQCQYDWDHPFYWVSQLFEDSWVPHPTYQREYNE